MPKEKERYLDIGCGLSKQSGSIGIDWHPFPGVDIVRDIRRGLPFDDNTVDRIICKHCIEHFDGDDLMFLVDEFWRVSKPSISWVIIVPDNTSPNRYRDPTHKTRDWSEDSFIFWEVDKEGKYLIHRGPMYNTHAKLQCVHSEVHSNLDRFYQLRVIK